MRTKLLLLSTALLVSCGQSSPDSQPDGTAPQADGADTNNALSIQGSDTEVQLVSNLAEAFAKGNPDVDISVTGGGSSVGIAALINKLTMIANSSRQMKDTEKSQAQANGLDVQEYILARDGLSIIVHPSNPITELTVQQISDMYRGQMTDWNTVGGEAGEIVLYGRQSTSGTFGFFRDAIVQDDYAVTMRQMEGTQAIVDAVIHDVQGVGYVGVGYVKEGSPANGKVKILNVASETGGEAASPLDREAVISGQYPISRRIYQYLAELPAKNSVIADFLRFESSSAGQTIIEETGFYPLTAEDIVLNEALFARMQ